VPSFKAKNIIGGRIRMARIGATPSLTQDDLSGRLAHAGVSLDRTGIAKVELGVRCVSDYEVRAFCKALRVSPGWLLGLTEEKSR
jgi:hypothetical protein